MQPQPSKIKCPRHQKNDIYACCITQGCDLECGMCTSCEIGHDHRQLKAISYGRLEAIMAPKQPGVKKGAYSTVQHLLSEFRKFASQLRQKMDVLLTLILERGEQILQKYCTAPKAADISTLLRKTGGELRKLVESHDAQEQAGFDLPPRLISEMLEYKSLQLPILKHLVQAAQLSKVLLLGKHTDEKQPQISGRRIEQSIEQQDRLFSFQPSTDKLSNEFEATLKKFDELCEKKAYAEVEKRAQAIISRNPLQPVTYLHRAKALFQLQDYRAAFACYSIHAELGKSLSSSMNRAICLIRLGQWHLGLRLCNQLLASNAAYANGHYYKAFAYRALKLYDQAYACAEKALKLNPEHRDAQNLRELLKTLPIN